MNFLLPVEVREGDPPGSHRYRIGYENATVVQLFVVNDQNKVTFIQSEVAELTSDARKKAE